MLLLEIFKKIIVQTQIQEVLFLKEIIFSLSILEEIVFLDRTLGHYFTRA